MWLQTQPCLNHPLNPNTTEEAKVSTGEECVSKYIKYRSPAYLTSEEQSHPSVSWRRSIKQNAPAKNLIV